MGSAASLRAAVEGDVDEVVLRRIVEHAGGRLEATDVFGRRGKEHLEQRIDAYNNAARFLPWVVLVDLHNDECAPALVASWLAAPSSGMCLRVAVRAVEAWLLADRQQVAQYLSVSQDLIPLSPDEENDPKRRMIDLAGRSRRRCIRDDMVPRPGSGLKVGDAYNSRLLEFAGGLWRPNIAREHSDSLHRSMEAVQRLVDSWRQSS